VATEKLGLDPGSFEIRPWTAPSGAQLHGIYGSAVPKPRYRVAGDAKTYMTRQMADGAARRSGGTVEAVASGDRTGEALYETLIKNFGSKEAASRALNEAGIPGIRYADAMSRGEKYRVKLSTSKGPYADNAFSTKEQAAAYAKEKEAEGFITETVDEGTSNYVIFDRKLLKIVGEGEDAAFKGGQVDKGLLQPYAPEVLQRAADGRPMRRAPMNPAAGDNILAAMDDQITPGYHGTGGHEGAGLDMADLEGTFWASRNPSLASEYAFHHGSPHRGVGDASVLPVNSRSKAAFDADQLPKTVTAGTFLNEIAAQAKAAGRPPIKLREWLRFNGCGKAQRLKKAARIITGMTSGIGRGKCLAKMAKPLSAK
jgi:nucleotide-binding universal stress UspA family protein